MAVWPADTPTVVGRPSAVAAVALAVTVAMATGTPQRAAAQPAPLATAPAAVSGTTPPPAAPPPQPDLRHRPTAPPGLALRLPAIPPGAAAAEGSAATAGDALSGTGSITFVGTATVLVRWGGFTFLTDPNFLHKGDHAHLGYGLSTPRLTEPAIAFENLPPIDFVLLSHYHGDHFDQLVEARLDKRTPILAPPQAVALLKKKEFTAAQALRTWQTVEVTKPRAGGGVARLSVTAMPGRHGPPVASKALPQVMGSLVELPAPTAGGRPWRLYVSGDTLVHDDLKQIPQRFPDIDLALLHLGGTRIFGMLVTMDAAQGVQALQLIQPRTAIPIHNDDYPVFKSPLADFLEAARRAGWQDRVKVLAPGERYDFTVGAAADAPAGPAPGAASSSAAAASAPASASTTPAAPAGGAPSAPATSVR